MIESRHETYGRNLFRQLDVLRDGFGPFYWAFLIDLFQLVAQVCPRVDDADQAILDVQVDVCAFLDLFGEVSFGLDRENFTTSGMLVQCRLNWAFVDKN